MRDYNKKYNISHNLGTALADGRVVVTETSWINYKRGMRDIFDTCRTVFGLSVRSRTEIIRGWGNKPIERTRNYIVLPPGAAELITMYESLPYSDLSLQEFLMKTWRK